MSISVVLRLAPAAVASRQLAGEAEIVATGERVLIGSVDDLIEFLSDAAPAELDPRPLAMAALAVRQHEDSGAPSHHRRVPGDPAGVAHGSMPARRRMGGSAR